jgi:hypothetical protein
MVLRVARRSPFRMRQLVLATPLLAAEMCPTTTSTEGAIQVEYRGLPAGASSIRTGAPLQPWRLIDGGIWVGPREGNVFGPLEPGSYTIHTDSAYTQGPNGTAWVPEATELSAVVSADETTVLQVPYHATAAIGVVVVSVRTPEFFTGNGDMIQVFREGKTEALPTNYNQAFALEPGVYRFVCVPFTFADTTYAPVKSDTVVTVTGGQVYELLLSYHVAAETNGHAMR